MRKKSRSWPILLAALCLCAFVVWFFWRDIERLLTSAGGKVTPQQIPKPSQEKISEEDRKKLEEILKRR